MNTYIGSAKYEYVDGLRSSTTTSNFSSALYTLSLIDSESRFLSFIFTTEALRPDLLNSAFCTTIGSLPSMITLPARSSCAIFISVVLHGLNCPKGRPGIAEAPRREISPAFCGHFAVMYKAFYFNKFSQNCARLFARLPLLASCPAQSRACAWSSSLYRQKSGQADSTPVSSPLFQSCQNRVTAAAICGGRPAQYSPRKAC